MRPRAPLCGRRSRRPPAVARHSPEGRRLPSLINGARLAGLALLLACSGAIGWLLTSDDFALDNVALELSGLRYSDAAAVRGAIGLPASGTTNVFLLNTTQMRRALAALPAVASIDVRATLPHRLVVAIVERVPVLMLGHDRQTYLVDADGVVLEQRPSDALALSDLPLVDDRRAEQAIDIIVGQPLSAIDGRAMLELGALTPALLESSAATLSVSVDDVDGYVVSAAPIGWRAVFGHYTPNLRPPDMIALQVQCLRTLLASGEAAIETIYLAPQGERCGTYLPRPTSRGMARPIPATWARM